MPTRISGMVTGIDTDTLVKQMMQAKRVPIDQLKQQQTKLEWKRDSYRDTNTLMTQLRDIAFNLRLQSTTGAKKGNTSDDHVVTATVGSATGNGSYSININNIAEAASMKSDVLGIANRTSEALNPTQRYVLNVTGEKGTKQVSIAQGSTISDVVAGINAQTNTTGVRATYDKVTDRLFFTSVNTGSQATISVSGTDSASESFLNGTLKVAVSAANQNIVTGSKVFANTQAVINKDLAASVQLSVNGATLTISKTTTIADLQDQLSRSTAGADVALSVDAAGKVRLESASAITLVDVSGQALQELGLDGTNAVASQAKTAAVRGKDASVDFNGITGIKYHANTMTMNAITFSLKDRGSATVTVGTDTDTVFNSIKDFVDKYNDILDKTYNKTHESTERSFQPLTDDQKKAMKDDEIKSWDAKAKQGLLRNDSILNGALNQLRNALMQPLVGIGAGQISELKDIGITTGAYFEHGKLYLNESALKQALTDKPDEVMNLFTKPSALYNPNTAVTGTKAFTSMNDVVDSSISGTVSFTVNGQTINMTSATKLSDLSKSISDATTGKVSLYLLDNKAVIQGQGTAPLTIDNAVAGVDALGKLGLAPGTTDVTKVTGTRSFAADTDVINSNLSSMVRFTLNGSYISIDKTTTVADLKQRVSAMSGGQVTLTRDSVSGLLTMQGASGTQVVLTNTDSGTDALDMIGFAPIASYKYGTVADSNANGIGHRLYKIFSDAIEEITGVAGKSVALSDTSVLGKQISEYKQRIDDKSRSLSTYEQQLYSKFAKLEAFTSKMNSQSSWLSQQLSSMGH